MIRRSKITCNSPCRRMLTQREMQRAAIQYAYDLFSDGSAVHCVVGYSFLRERKRSLWRHSSQFSRKEHVSQPTSYVGASVGAKKEEKLGSHVPLFPLSTIKVNITDRLGRPRLHKTSKGSNRDWPNLIDQTLQTPGQREYGLNNVLRCTLLFFLLLDWLGTD
jgi:hypothetical protein